MYVQVYRASYQNITGTGILAILHILNTSHVNDLTLQVIL